MQNTKSAIVVVIDRLGAGMLGPYGNTWLDTPNFNRLAAESCLFEYAIADSPRLDLVYRSYWYGIHAMCLGGDAGPPGLAELLTHAGIETTLLTDEPGVESIQHTDQFANKIVISPSTCTGLAKDVENTHLARIFAEITERMRLFQPNSLFWVHASAMKGPWDAPMHLREQYADEEDPVPPDFVQPPSIRLDDDYDPDELLGITHAYAGQVALLDMCIGALLDSLEETTSRTDTLLILTSPRGFPLGEHRRIGSYDQSLYGELLHVPWILRPSDRALSSRRTRSLIQPADLYATLLDWFGIESERNLSQSRSLQSVLRDQLMADRACSILGSQRSIRTPAWFLRSGPASSELFVKPDDRWEANEVSNRCVDVVAEMLSVLDDFYQSSQSLESCEFAPLPEVLLHGLQ